MLQQVQRLTKTDLFYEQLEHALEKIPAKDMLVVMSDWNAKIG